MKPLIAVTGIGTLTAAGSSVSEMWQNVRDGKSPASWREIPIGRSTVRVPVCAVPALDDHLADAPRLRRMDRCVRLAHGAATEAWNDAGLNHCGFDPERAAVFVGTSRGPVESCVRAAAQLRHKRLRPTEAPGGAIASLSGALSLTFGIRGPAVTVSASCVSGAAAIALAAQQILAGSADVVLAGGAEAPLIDVVLAQLHSARVLGTDDDPKRACRPFDTTRNGTVLGEGAAFLILESLDSALQRGARVHALLAGWGVGSEGASRTGIDETGESLCKVMNRALSMSGLEPGAIGYLNLHGTGTRLNDRVEPRAMRLLFGESTSRISCSATKPLTGHCMGAGSVIESVISILAMKNGCLPATLNCDSREPGCPLNLIVGAPRRHEVNAVMSNSSGFWGTNASLVFARAPAR